MDPARRPDVPGLHQFRASSFLTAVPGLADQFREVPPEWWTEGEGASMECPCGFCCLLIPRARFVECHGCYRVYLLTRTRLLCAQGCSDEELAAAA